MFDDQMVNQLKMFCKMCHYAKTNAAFGGKGITKDDLYKKGMTDDTFKWLVKHHYCNEQKPNQPLWVAINGNRYHPTQTIQNMEKAIKAYEATKAS